MADITVTCACTRKMAARSVPKGSYRCGCGAGVRITVPDGGDGSCVAPGCVHPARRTEVMPLCGEHAEQLAFALAPDVYATYPPTRWVELARKYALRFATQPVQPKWALELEAVRDRSSSNAGASSRVHDPVVYFAVVGDLVKIGTTTNIVERFACMNLPPTKRVHVIPGWYEVERRFHERFDAERHPDTEWFTLSDRLRAHLDELIQQGEAKCPSSVTPRWCAPSAPVAKSLPTNTVRAKAPPPQRRGGVIYRDYGTRKLVDAAALFVHMKRRIAIQTIRARCEPVEVDQATGRKLYDLDEAEKVLATVRTRAPHRRGKGRVEA